MSTLTRQISIVAAFLVLFGALFTFQYLSNQKAPPKKSPPKAKIVQMVEAIPIQNASIPSILDIQGRLKAFDKIDIFAEVSGTLESTSNPFKVGSYFKKGAILLSIDNEEAHLNLLSQKSSLENAITQMMPDLKIDYPESFQQWKDYLDQFDVNVPIKAFPEPVNDQEKYLVSSKNLNSQYYNIKSAETRLSKYKVYAPFSGVLTATNINPGSLVRSGQKMGELMNKNTFELEATVSMRDLDRIKRGGTVQLYSDNINGKWNGKVSRISDQIDPNTQSVIVFITVSGKNLREGMYLRGEITSGSIADAVEVPRDVLVDNKAVYKIVGDSLLQLTPVEVVQIKGTKAIVKGLENNTQILKEIFSSFYDGMKVQVRKS